MGPDLLMQGSSKLVINACALHPADSSRRACRRVLDPASHLLLSRGVVLSQIRAGGVPCVPAIFEYVNAARALGGRHGTIMFPAIFCQCHGGDVDVFAPFILSGSINDADFADFSGVLPAAGLGSLGERCTGQAQSAGAVASG